MLVKLLRLWMTICLSAIPCFAEGRQDLSLTVSLPKGKAPTTLFVVFENHSEAPIRLWQNSNFWGWNNLSVVLIRRGVPLFYVRRLNEPFTANWPTFDKVPAGHRLERKIVLADGSWICSGRAVAEILDSDTIIATYVVSKSEERDTRSVWTGVACGGLVPNSQVKE